MLTELFEQFVKERKYLKNVTPKTIIYYNNSWASFRRMMPIEDADQLSRHFLNEYVVNLRESGIKPVSCNTYISGINAFLSWLHENGHTPERLTIKKLKVEQQVVKTIEEDALKAILTFKPKTFGEFRIHALLCLLLDTGIRIEEALTLQPDAIDLNNMFEGYGQVVRRKYSAAQSYLLSGVWKIKRRTGRENMFGWLPQTVTSLRAATPIT